MYIYILFTLRESRRGHWRLGGQRLSAIGLFLGDLWGSLAAGPGGPWRFLGGLWGVLGGPWESLAGLWGFLGGPWAKPQGV